MVFSHQESPIRHVIIEAPSPDNAATQGLGEKAIREAKAYAGYSTGFTGTNGTERHPWCVFTSP